ncbi:hypothetical protein [Pedobacter cryoconitis]|uniref:Uncharacterized protein n=1 Tax=Pedobacter cryoconitis TaxID=188932 RepID=A0A327TD31_9SPHI|nr:hypothetical protein [Pedobacter cryoconitis]RAJ35747.1 hypothetical protein LY11_00994 [Pedobacter cryoconitis]
MIDHYDTISYTDKAKVDPLLTDAMIAFINQWHYGKLNPDYPAVKIDRGGGFNAGHALQEQMQAFSNGNILVENAEKPAVLFLKNEDDISTIALMYKAIKNGETKTFKLKKQYL